MIKYNFFSTRVKNIFFFIDTYMGNVEFQQREYIDPPSNYHRIGEKDLFREEEHYKITIYDGITWRDNVEDEFLWKKLYALEQTNKNIENHMQELIKNLDELRRSYKEDDGDPCEYCGIVYPNKEYEKMTFCILCDASSCLNCIPLVGIDPITKDELYRCGLPCHPLNTPYIYGNDIRKFDDIAIIIVQSQRWDNDYYISWKRIIAHIYKTPKENLKKKQKEFSKNYYLGESDMKTWQSPKSIDYINTGFEKDDNRFYISIGYYYYDKNEYYCI